MMKRIRIKKTNDKLLVERDRLVHLADEDESGSESDEACDEEEADGDDEGIAEVEESRDKGSDF